MKPNVMLTISSLLTILFLTFHLSDEIARGMEPGGLNMVIPVLVLAVWLYGTPALAGRRSGHIIMLIMGILERESHTACQGRTCRGRIAVDSSGSFFWVWQNSNGHDLGLLYRPRVAYWNPEWGKSE